MNCSRCNIFGLPKDAKFCPNCGRNLKEPLIIDSCTISPMSINYGDICKIEWHGCGVKMITVGGKDFTPSDPILLMPSKSSDIDVLFIGESGDTNHLLVPIVVKVPRAYLTIRCAPEGKHLPDYFTTEDDIEIYWDTKNVKKVELDGVEVSLDYRFITRKSAQETIHTIRYYAFDDSYEEEEFCIRGPRPAIFDEFDIIPHEAKEGDWVRILDDKVKYCHHWEIYHENDLKNRVNIQWNSRHMGKLPGGEFIVKPGNYVVKFFGEDDSVQEKIMTPCAYPNASIRFEVCPIVSRKYVYRIKWSAKDVLRVVYRGKECDFGGEMVFDASSKVAYCAYNYLLKFELQGSNGNNLDAFCKIELLPENKEIPSKSSTHKFLNTDFWFPKYLNFINLGYTTVSDVNMASYDKKNEWNNIQSGISPSCRTDNECEGEFGVTAWARGGEYYNHIVISKIHALHQKSMKEYERSRNRIVCVKDENILDNDQGKELKIAKPNVSIEQRHQVNFFGLYWEDSYEQWMQTLYNRYHLQIHNNRGIYYATDEDEKIIIEFGKEKDIISIYERTNPVFDEIWQNFHDGIEPEIVKECRAQEELKKSREEEHRQKELEREQLKEEYERLLSEEVARYDPLRVRLRFHFSKLPIWKKMFCKWSMKMMQKEKRKVVEMFGVHVPPYILDVVYRLAPDNLCEQDIRVAVAKHLKKYPQFGSMENKIIKK